MSVAGSLAVARERRKPRWRLGRFGLPALGGAVLLVWLAATLLAPLIAPYGPNEMDMASRLAAPSLQHPMGTDTLGRDVLSRVLYGARMTLFASLSVVVVGMLIGTVIGAAAAWSDRWFGELLMRFTDLVMCFPPIILAMAIAAALGVGPGNTIIAMLVVWWPKFARLARSQVLVQLQQEYVDAARINGCGGLRILLRHVAPNAIGPLVVLMTVDLGTAIITFASLSFLGLGVVPPTPEWGAMIAEGREFFDQWWIAAFPGLAILSVVVAFNFLGDGIRDWLDPRSRG